MEKNTKTQTSLLEDSHVNLGRLQELKREAKTTEISGTKWLGLLKTYGHDGSLARMCQALLQCQWVSEEVSLTWKVSGIKPYHILFQLQPSMPNIDECDAGLWATPNTMDHLPPRSEEGTTKLMEGQRKGRTKPANLREQVDEQTMNLYKQTSSTLWPTPTHQTAGTGPLMKTLVTKEGTPAKQGERAYNPKTGKHVQVTLNRAVNLWPTPNASPVTVSQTVEATMKLRGRDRNQGQLMEAVVNKMWPTPTTQEIEHPEAELTANNRRLSKDGKTSHSLNLADSVKMYPTPRARDWKDGYTVPPSIQKGTRAHTLGTFVAEKESMWPTPTTKGYGHASMGQTMIFRKKVERGELTEQQAEQMLGVTLRPPRMEKWDYPKKEMFPTPSANEDAAGRPGGKMQKMLGNHPSVRDQSSGTLNPTWVEWLMGYEIGYTDLDV